MLDVRQPQLGTPAALLGDPVRQRRPCRVRHPAHPEQRLVDVAVRVDEAGQQQTARHVHYLSSRICPQVRLDQLDDPFSYQDVGRGVHAPWAAAAQQQIRHGLSQSDGGIPAADHRVGRCTPGRPARRGIVDDAPPPGQIPCRNPIAPDLSRHAARSGYRWPTRCALNRLIGSGCDGEYNGMADVMVRRVDFGYFIRPAEETGMGVPRVEPCLSYAVGHPEGMILFDTGMGSHPEVDAHYRPRRVGLGEALAAIGTQISDIRLAANCHLHFDHCGGNPLLGQIPVFVQDTELGTARQAPGYTLPELIDGSRFEPVAGQAEMLPGVFLMPTPGHTDGHQSLIVRRPDGAVIVAGQSHDTATQYAADQLAWQAHRDAHDQSLPGIPDWIDAFQRLNPRIVYFAHDRSVWTP